MCGRETIVEILKAHYGAAVLLGYSESDDEIRFQLSVPIIDRQTAGFRSRVSALEALAVSHRLSMLIGRGKCGVPEDFGFAIKSVETTVHRIARVVAYDVALRFEVIARRNEVIAALSSTLVTRFGADMRITTTVFNIVPPSLANFVRRVRRFQDYADVRISREQSALAVVADNRFQYQPSEEDRLSDGTRVDHVPALTLIDIALFVNRMTQPGAAGAQIRADFLAYTDPRLAFEIVRTDDGVMEFVQGGQVVAIVSDCGCPGDVPTDSRADDTGLRKSAIPERNCRGL